MHTQTYRVQTSCYSFIRICKTYCATAECLTADITLVILDPLVDILDVAQHVLLPGELDRAVGARDLLRLLVDVLDVQLQG